MPDQAILIITIALALAYAYGNGLNDAAGGYRASVGPNFNRPVIETPDPGHFRLLVN